MESLKLSKNLQIFVASGILSLLLFSCDNDFEEKNNQATRHSNLREEIKITEGTVEIDSKTILKDISNLYKENVENQNNFNKEIRRIQKEGFKPLTPLFDKNDTEKIRKFAVDRIEKINARNIEYGITSKPGLEEVDIEDELISDPVLANLLNEKREIIVGDSLYKYTETGLYFCKRQDKDKLYDYLENLKLSDKLNVIQQAKMTGKSSVSSEVVQVTYGVSRFVPEQPAPEPYDEYYYGYANPSPIPSGASPKFIKQNLEIAYVEKNSIWEKIFGASEKAEDYYSDDRRVQVSFWNQNYFIFSSVGCSVRLQKREKLLGVCYWKKSYADVIELGINDVQYDYKFNTAKYDLAAYNYNTVFFEYKGVKYTIDGRIVNKTPTEGPKFIFDTGDPEAGLTMFIHHEEYNLLSAKELNKVIDELAKLFVKNLPSIYDKAILDNKIKNESLKYNVVIAPSLSNSVTFKTQNVIWSRNDDNSITNYFDFNFLFTWKSSYNDFGDYLKGLSGATKYNNVSVDLYGAALHNGEWRGRRLILNGDQI